MSIPFDAVLLAGGRASRVGGVDKTAFTTRGATLLSQAVGAASGAATLVVVGARDGAILPAGAIATREDPPWSGPVAALSAGLAAVDDPSPTTLVLACDLPRASAAVHALRQGRSVSDDTGDGLIALDGDGRRQPLLALYRTAALRDRLDALLADGPLAGLSMRRLLDGLDLDEVALDDALCADVDTLDDAERLGVRPASTPMSPAAG